MIKSSFWHLATSIACLLQVATVAAQSKPDTTADKSDKATAVKEEAVPEPSRLFEPREYADADGNVLRYRLLKPVDYDPTEKYPLVIFLHGAGERGDDNTAQLKHGMRDFCLPERREEFPCYVLAPQCPTDEKWADVDWRLDHVELPEKISAPAQLVMELVDLMLEKAAIDKNRIYVTGLSMGGYGSWDLIYRRPNFFAAALPICGGADPATAEAIQHVPIWCFHGAKDRAVKVEFSRDIIAALEKAGAEPKYTEYPEAGHDSWTATYANQEIYDWMFSQRLTRQSRSKE